MAKAREPKVFRSMDDLPLMLTPYDLMDFLGKGPATDLRTYP